MTAKAQKWMVGMTETPFPPPPDIEHKAFPEAEIRYLPDWRTSEENRRQWSQVDALLVWFRKIDRATVQLLDRCRIVVCMAVGYEKHDIQALEQRGIPFCNTPDYGTEEVADTAAAMVLALQRKLFSYDRACRGYARGWMEHVQPPLNRTSLQTLGIVGVGRIGTALVNRLKPFGYRIIGYDPYQPSGHEKAVAYGRMDSLEELLSQADIVSLHCPLTPETRGILNTATLKMMKPGSSLVNTARGDLLADLDCIHDALRSGRLASAALDVLPDEPPPKSHALIQAWARDADWINGRLIINPHNAFYSQQAYHDCRYKAAETARLHLVAGRLRNQILP